MAYDYRPGAPAGVPSFPDFYRQQREREQQIEAVARAQVGRYTRRSPSDSPPTQETYDAYAAAAAGAFPQAFDGQAAYDAPYDPSVYIGTPPQSQGPYHTPSPPQVLYHTPSPPQNVYAGTPSPPGSQGGYSTAESLPLPIADAYPIQYAPTGYEDLTSSAGTSYDAQTIAAAAAAGAEMTQEGIAHYRSHVFKYPTSRVPAYGGVPAASAQPGGSALAPWATTAPRRAPAPAPSAEAGQGRKVYTKKPLHVAPPPPALHADEPYMREAFSLSAEMDLTLASLRDPPAGERPNYPLPLLCALAIHGSAAARLTLAGIFEAIEARFVWYRENADQKSWKNSVRHLLSLHKIFRQEPRPITEPGKGHYWKLDFSQGIGNKRERKRRARGTAAPAAPERSPSRESELSEQRQSSAGPQRRPRPRRAAPARTSPAASDGSGSSQGSVYSPSTAPPAAGDEFFDEPAHQFGQTGFGTAPAAPAFGGFGGWPAQGSS